VWFKMLILEDDIFSLDDTSVSLEIRDGMNNIQSRATSNSYLESILI
jgi:hypothetical protein